MNIERNKLPWFKLYGNEFLAHTIGLTNEEVGIYIRLLAYSWVHGPLPNSIDAITSIVGEGSISRVLVRFFKIDRNGERYDPWLESLRSESLESAEKRRNQTAAATAKRREQSSRQRNDDVTSRDTESDTESDTRDQIQESESDTESDTSNVTDVPVNLDCSFETLMAELENRQSDSAQSTQPDGEAQGRTDPDHNSAPLTRDDLNQSQKEYYDSLEPEKRESFLTEVAEYKAEQKSRQELQAA